MKDSQMLRFTVAVEAFKHSPDPHRTDELLALLAPYRCEHPRVMTMIDTLLDYRFMVGVIPTREEAIAGP